MLPLNLLLPLILVDLFLGSPILLIFTGIAPQPNSPRFGQRQLKHEVRGKSVNIPSDGLMKKISTKFHELKTH
jgi:hypothetical protein